MRHKICGTFLLAHSVVSRIGPGESGYGEFRRVEGFSIFVDMERAMAWQPGSDQPA